MKKLISLFMAILIALSATASLSLAGLAVGDLTEQENNDTSDTANRIPSDQYCRGKLNYDEDIDWYIVENNKDYFTLSFDVLAYETSVEQIRDGWYITIYEESGEILKEYSCITSSFETRILPVSGSFLIKIQAQSSYYSPNGCVYRLKMNTVSDSSWENEYNDTPATAFAIDMDSVYHGILQKYEDCDWYIAENKGEAFSIDFSSGKNTDLSNIRDGWYVEIYSGTDLTPIAEFDGVTKNLTTPEYPFSEEILIKVSAQSSFYAPLDCYYDLKINTVQDDAWESELNDTIKTADSILAGKSYKADLYTAKDVDCFVVTTKTGAFNVEFDLPEAYSSESIQDGWQISVYPYGSADPITRYDNIKESVKTFDLPYKGKFMIEVKAQNDWYAPVHCIYNLKVTEHSASELWEGEVNDTMKKATALTFGKLYHANLDRDEDVDYFKFTATSNGTATFAFNRDVTDYLGDGWKIVVLKADGTEVFNEIVKNSLSLSGVSFPMKAGETYYVKVCADNSWYAPKEVNYTVSVSFKAQPVNITSLKVSKYATDSLTLTWNKLSGAKGYKIFTYDAKAKKYTQIGDTTSNTFTAKKLKAGTAYTLCVRAYTVSGGKASYISNIAKITTGTRPEKAANLKVTQNTQAIKLTWNKVSGATGYKVYLYQGSKCLKYAFTSNTYYTFSSLKAGTQYKVYVKAYKRVGSTDIYAASASGLATATQPLAPNFTVKSTEKGKAVITWKASVGASGYMVYVSTSKGWKALKNTTARSYTATGLKAGATYKFAVRPYIKVGNTTVWGSYKTQSVKISSQEPVEMSFTYMGTSGY